MASTVMKGEQLIRRKFVLLTVMENYGEALASSKSLCTSKQQKCRQGAVAGRRNETQVLVLFYSNPLSEYLLWPLSQDGELTPRKSDPAS